MKKNNTNKMLLFTKKFFDKRKVNYIMTITDENKINVNIRE